MTLVDAYYVDVCSMHATRKRAGAGAACFCRVCFVWARMVTGQRCFSARLTGRLPLRRRGRRQTAIKSSTNSPPPRTVPCRPVSRAAPRNGSAQLGQRRYGVRDGSFFFSLAGSGGVAIILSPTCLPPSPARARSMLVSETLSTGTGVDRTQVRPPGEKGPTG